MAASSADLAKHARFVQPELTCFPARPSLPLVDRTPRNVDETLRALETTTEWLLERGDPRAAFADVYAVITRRVKAAIEDTRSPVFLDPAWISRLTGLFCARYLDYLFASLEGCTVTPKVWASADKHGKRGDVAPALQALLGINAHINYDLALGLRDNVLSAGAAGDAQQLARYRHDHDAVNTILRDAMPEILDRLAHHHGCDLSRIFGGAPRRRALLIRAVLAVLTQWRDRVWSDLGELLQAKTEGEEDEIRERLDRNANAIARAIGALGVGSGLVERALGAPRRLGAHRPAREATARQLALAA